MERRATRQWVDYGNMEGDGLRNIASEFPDAPENIHRRAREEYSRGFDAEMSRHPRISNDAEVDAIIEGQNAALSVYFTWEDEIRAGQLGKLVTHSSPAIVLASFLELGDRSRDGALVRVPETLSGVIPEILSGLRSEVRSNGQTIPRVDRRTVGGCVHLEGAGA